MIMRTQKAGITFIEILMIIVMVVFVAAILFPIITRYSNRHHHSQCTSNLRQLAMAATMYCQDNKNLLPGLYKRLNNGTFSPTYTGWVGDVITYVKGGTDVTTPTEMMICDELPKSDKKQSISYGYNACLLNADGTGINESNIKQPTQVGVLCDATPGIPFPAIMANEKGVTYGGGGIIGGYSLIFSGKPGEEQMGSKLAVLPEARHMGSVTIGYADGHAQRTPDYVPNDSIGGVTRAFYMCTALGLVDNPAAGLGGAVDNPFGIVPANTVKSYTVIGGDPVTRPIIRAACEVAKKMMPGFNYKNAGFTGSLSAKKRPSDYLEGIATIGAPPINVGDQSNCVQIGVDAMVVVVNKNCAIKINNIDLTRATFSHPGGSGKWRQISIKDLQTIISSNGYEFADRSVSGLDEGTHDWQLYLQGKNDVTRKLIAETTATFTTPGGFGAYYKDGGYTGQTNYKIRTKSKLTSDDIDTFRGTYCEDDLDIVDKVANDTLGIGIVSAACADTKKIDILAINFGSPATTATFPTSVASQNPGVYPPTCTWPFRRNLYAYYTTGKTSEKVANLAFKTYKTTFQNGPLYKTSFWK
jgi:prepilin-type processing-associated H-X9-DG protein